MSGLPQVSSVRSALPWLLATCLAAVLPRLGVAQSSESGDFRTPTYAPPAHVSVVDGDVWLSRDGETDLLDENEPLIEGDRVSTERGRLEVLFHDGSALALDDDSTLDVLAPTFFRLIEGRVALTLDRRVSPGTYRIDAAGSAVWLQGGGEYRIAADGSGPEAASRVTVIRGLAELSAPGGRTTVRAGYEARLAHGGETLMTVAVPVTSWAPFDRWVDAQTGTRLNTSRHSYLPSEIRVYAGVLDQYGDWRYEPPYGYAWYPRVAMDWSPYSTGRWVSVAPYGWTWVGTGRWAWPTHHYGRWITVGARWCWIPGRTWAPAWVTWAAAPGYVAWSPSGYAYGTTSGLSVGSLGRGWTVVAASAFSTRRLLATDHGVPPARVNTPFSIRAAAPPRPVSRTALATDRPPASAASVARPRSAGVGLGTRQSVDVPRRTDALPPARAPRTGGAPDGRTNRAPLIPPDAAAPVQPQSTDARRPRAAPAAPAAPRGGVLRAPVEQRDTEAVRPLARPRRSAPEPASRPPSVGQPVDTPPQAPGVRQPAGRPLEVMPTRPTAPPRPPNAPAVEAPRSRGRGAGVAAPPASGQARPRAEPRHAPPGAGDRRSR